MAQIIEYLWNPILLELRVIIISFKSRNNAYHYFKSYI